MSEKGDVSVEEFSIPEDQTEDKPKSSVSSRKSIVSSVSSASTIEKKKVKKKDAKQPGFEFYNAEQGTLLGRTLSSWLKILVFYVAYFTFLAGLFTASVQLMEKQLPVDKPKLQTRLNVPGLHYFPYYNMMNPEEKQRFAENDGITFSYNDGEIDGDSGYGYYVNATNRFMDGYQNTSEVTDFDLETLGPCSPVKSGSNFGWDIGSPCLFFRLNRVIDWEPVGLFEPEEDSYFSLPGNNPTKPMVLDATYVRCMAKNENNEQMEGELFRYYGGDANGGDGYFGKEFFPYKGKHIHPNYESPIVAVQIVGLEKGETYKIRCAAFGANFLHDGKHREGEITFYYKVVIEEEEPEIEEVTQSNIELNDDLTEGETVDEIKPEQEEEN